MFIKVWAIHIPKYTNPFTKKEVDEDVVVVPATTMCRVSPKPITPDEAREAAVIFFPALKGLNLSVKSGGTMKRMHCDIQRPELFLKSHK